MAKIEIDVGEVAAKEIEKRDRKIKRLEEQLEGERRINTDLRNTLFAIKRAKEALLEAADHLDPLRYEDL